MWKRLLSVMLVSVLLLGLCACGGDLTTLMEDGSNRFGAGKNEEDYSMRNSGALLDKLIDDYSGAYYFPTSSQMDDDDYEDAKKKAEGDDATPDGGSDPTDSTEDPAGDIAEVGSWEDLLKVFHEAYAATQEYLTFRVVNGFVFDPSVDLQKSFTELQRQDPIGVSCVKQWSWGVQGDVYVFDIDYTMEVSQLITIKAQTEDLVEKAAASIDTTNASDYEIVCAVNDYLCDTVYYPPTEPYAPITHTAYGALHDGVAVCEGYACAAKLILNELGVYCDIQVGTCTGGGGHAWNLVQLDGQWYQMDVTWNDGSSDRTDYLLVTDDYMRKSRTWDFASYPACAKTPYTP